MSFGSPNPLHSHLSRLSLNHGALQDEDLTLTIGDDSFEQSQGASSQAQDDTTTTTAASDPDGPAQRAFGAGDVAFGGSMGALPSSGFHDGPVEHQLGSSEAATTTTPKPATKPHSSDAARDYANEQAEDDDIDYDNNDWSEEDKRRILELKAERDGLRVMNKTLADLLGGLHGMDVKLQAFGENIETAHGLLDLYSRIAAQAEHTQALLLDTQWQGVTHDAQLLLAREAEAARLAQEESERLERERIEAEEAAAAADRAAQDAAARQALESKRGARGRGRGTVGGSARGAGSGSSLRGGSSTFPSSANSSGIGRGASSSTGVGRGSGTVTGVRGVRGLRSRVMTRGGVGRGRGD